MAFRRNTFRKLQSLLSFTVRFLLHMGIK